MGTNAMGANQRGGAAMGTRTSTLTKRADRGRRCAHGPSAHVGIHVVMPGTYVISISVIASGT